MKFLEHWMEYITGAIRDPAQDTYFYQLHYPSQYKSNETRIIKFERDYKNFLEYRFIGLFPLSLNSTRVSYNNSQVLKATANFSFDRYICGESTSLARDLRRAYNEIFSRGNVSKDGSSVDPTVLNSGVYPTVSQGDRSKVDTTTSGRTSGQVNNVNGSQNLGTGQVISNGRR